jgi:plasmid replication initiation protein
MSKGQRQSISEQFDLFLPYLADLPLRDQREMMERPFFSLAKTKRVKPIDYTSPDGKLWVNVSPNPTYGMATIWDADILIYCASMLADMARRGANDVPRKLHIMPYDLLRAIGRPTTGRAYELMSQALDRLVATTVKTNIRAENRREATFSWLDGWTQLVDEKTERSRGMTLELSNWFYEGVLMNGGVLAIDRAYFNLTGGRERWLYKVARKHAGGAGDGGFSIAMPTLFEKSGAEGPYRRFKFEIIKIAERNTLPGYNLSIEVSKSGTKEPLLRMVRCDSKATNEAGQGASVSASKKLSPGKVLESNPPDKQPKAPNPPQSNAIFDAGALVRTAVAGLADASTRGYMTDDTLALLRQECPGWDLYTLHADFETWVNADPSRLPANWQRAFIGYVRKWHEKHRHQLRS